MGELLLWVIIILVGFLFIGAVIAFIALIAKVTVLLIFLGGAVYIYQSFRSNKPQKDPR